jgi:hypothetical protein
MRATLTHQHHNSIGGLVVKLAVAISKDLRIQEMSASPGFDSRPMHRGARDSFQGRRLPWRLFVCCSILLFLFLVSL